VVTHHGQTGKGRHLSRNQGWKSPATGRLSRFRPMARDLGGRDGAGLPGPCWRPAGGPAGCCGTDAGSAPTWARMNPRSASPGPTYRWRAHMGAYSATIWMRERIASSSNAPQRRKHCLARMLPSLRHFVNRRRTGQIGLMRHRAFAAGPGTAHPSADLIPHSAKCAAGGDPRLQPRDRWRLAVRAACR
jgi:hypothetical protein